MGNAAKKLITQAEWARLKGWNRSYVTKLVKLGKVTLIDGMIDPGQAERQLHAASDPSQAGRHKSVVKTKPTTQEAPTQSVIDITPSIDFNSARTMREAYSAKIRKMEYEKLKGELIEVGTVKRDAYRVGRRIRGRMEAIPARLDTLLAAETDPRVCRRMMMDEITKALEGLPIGEADE